MMSESPFSLNGKKILVTGASSGIGRSIAIDCSKMGALIIVCGRNTERLAETCGQLKGTGHLCRSFELTNEDDIKKCVLDLPALDGVVHCAGVYSPLPATFINRSTIEEIFNINLFSVMELNKYLIVNKKINRNGSVVLISSISAGLISEHGNSLYSSSKAALCAYAKVLALELSAKKIRVNSLLPGMIRTKLLEDMAMEKEDFVRDEKRYPLGYGAPEDVANASIYLLSDASKWMTGCNIVIDGGRTLR